MRLRTTLIISAALSMSVLAARADDPQQWDPLTTAQWEISTDGGKTFAPAKFIFLESHYPAWTSGSHAKYAEVTMTRSREVVLPLLVKYKATAMIVGHDHNYERSEFPDGKGVTSITAGGAGAPLRGQMKNPEKYNPYTKVFYWSLHYVVFDVTADKVEMKTYALDGKVVDERTFLPRK